MKNRLFLIILNFYIFCFYIFCWRNETVDAFHHSTRSVISNDGKSSSDKPGDITTTTTSPLTTATTITPSHKEYENESSEQQSESQMKNGLHEVKRSIKNVSMLIHKLKELTEIVNQMSSKLDSMNDTMEKNTKLINKGEMVTFLPVIDDELYLKGDPFELDKKIENMNLKILLQKKKNKILEGLKLKKPINKEQTEWKKNMKEYIEARVKNHLKNELEKEKLKTHKQGSETVESIFENFYLDPSGEELNERVQGDSLYNTHIVDQITDEDKTSVFFVPGIGGSSLIAQLDNVMISSCGEVISTKKPFRIWVSVTRVISLRSTLECTIDIMKLNYNREDGKYYNTPGVRMDVEEYGSLKGINYLDYFRNSKIGIIGTKYFNDLSKYYEKRGYVENDSLMGLPYDWRFPLYQQNYDKFKQYIEYIYEKRGGVKANLVGHSLGCLFINFFLNHRSNKEWNTKYINSITFINAPFLGSIKIIRSLVHGAGDFIYVNILDIAKFSLPDDIVKELNLTLGSMLDLLPYRQYYKRNQVVILINKGKEKLKKKTILKIIRYCGLYNPECFENMEDFNVKVYTLENWMELLNDDYKERIKVNAQYVDRQFEKDHGVPIFCITSVQGEPQTERVYFFQSDDFNEDPEIFYGLGDGTVNKESLDACNKFYNHAGTKVLHNVNHTDIISFPELMDHLYSITSVNYSAETSTKQKEHESIRAFKININDTEKKILVAPPA